MAHHEPFKSLAPIDWAAIPHDDLTEFLTTTFASAQTLIDSIPVPPAAAQSAAAKTGRARSHTDSDVRTSSSSHVELNRALAGREHSNSSPSAAWASKLEKEWKEIKLKPQENPLGIAVYKLSAKDGRGAWFARRSVHDGFTFEKFKLGLEREFAEALKINEGPGSGAVRGIGAERKAEQETCPGVGKIEVYQLSAQFPGPTTPRDFVTLLLTSDAGVGAVEKGSRKGRVPRQFMVVSKPCNHPECAPRSGYIRGQYESVEIIREVPVEKPLRRTRSSINLSRDDVKVKDDGNVDISKEAMLRSARKAAAAASENEDGHKRSISLTQSMTMPTESGDDVDDTDTAIEWLMITRSDPGGSVPRFMVEKGTPGGIVSDAGRFLKWLSSKDPRDFEESEDNDFKEEAIKSEQTQPDKASKPISRQERSLSDTDLDREELSPTVEAAAPSGFYGIIANALGVAGSMVATRLPILSGSARGSEQGDTSDIDSSDTSSERSFVSAEGPEQEEKKDTDRARELGNIDDAASEVASKHSGASDESKAISATASQHEKELKKLQERRRRIEEKMAKAQEQKMAKKGNDSEDAVAKLREKHERELAKQEEKYQRELKKLEENRKKEEKKAEERRRKQLEREEKNNAAMELERVKIERDMALKQIDILKDQVGELQSQNTMLVAKLGKLGALGKD